MKLRTQMKEVVMRARALVRTVDDHWTICDMVARQFDLYDEEDRFPTWLSRVIEGEMRDQNHDTDPV